MQIKVFHGVRKKKTITIEPVADFEDTPCRETLLEFLYLLYITSDEARPDEVLQCFEETGTTQRRGSGRPLTVTPTIKTIVEEQMWEDDETTAVPLGRLLQNKGCTLTQSTILRSRSSLGWTFRGSGYCQMIRQANETKHLEFATQYSHKAETGFLDVVYTDETFS
jgi:hypothetical protein